MSIEVRRVCTDGEYVGILRDTCCVSLQIVLAFGNYMNSSKRGAAYGFRLQSLDLVSDHMLFLSSFTVKWDSVVFFNERRTDTFLFLKIKTEQKKNQLRFSSLAACSLPHTFMCDEQTSHQTFLFVAKFWLSNPELQRKISQRSWHHFFQLLDTKSTDRSQTLLQFITNIIQEKYPDLTNFHSELHFVDKAALGISHQ